MNMDIEVGDRVICSTGVKGIVVQQYFPTASAQQTMIRTDDNRLYHAPTTMFMKERSINRRQPHDYQ